MGMYQPEIETMDRNELEKLQLERLQKQVKNVYENVPMYRERMDKKGVKPEDIKELKDLTKIVAGNTLIGSSRHPVSVPANPAHQ